MGAEGQQRRDQAMWTSGFGGNYDCPRAGCAGHLGLTDKRENKSSTKFKQLKRANPRSDRQSLNQDSHCAIKRLSDGKNR